MNNLLRTTPDNDTASDPVDYSLMRILKNNFDWLNA